MTHCATVYRFKVSKEHIIVVFVVGLLKRNSFLCDYNQKASESPHHKDPCLDNLLTATKY